MYWVFVVFVMVVVFFCGLLIGFALGDDNRHE